MTTQTDTELDIRATRWLGDASSEVAGTWRAARDAVRTDAPPMGLAAGERPAADVEVLAGALATCEYLLATRMHGAAVAGSLPLPSPGGMLAARGWSIAASRRLARCGALVADHPALAAAWAGGVITSEHVDAIARCAHRFSGPELAAVVHEVCAHSGAWSPAAIARFVTAAARMLHPPDDPTRDEASAHESRDLSFAVLGDTVLLSAQLPRVEGELVMAAIDALAERLRTTADHVPAGSRRADALVQLVNDAHAADALPTRGGLPVALTVTLEHTGTGDPLWLTGRGHPLTSAEARWAACDAAVTPVRVDSGRASGPGGSGASPGERIAALATTLFDRPIPLDVGRTQRTATPAQRRALAVRDRGCVIPGCGVAAEACQSHHVTEWAEGGLSDLDNMVLVCWSHHRQVDLGMWTIEPRSGPDAPSSPARGAPPGTPWAANNGAPFTIRRTPRHTWRQ